MVFQLKGPRQPLLQGTFSPKSAMASHHRRRCFSRGSSHPIPGIDDRLGGGGDGSGFEPPLPPGHVRLAGHQSLPHSLKKRFGGYRCPAAHLPLCLHHIRQIAFQPEDGEDRRSVVVLRLQRRDRPMPQLFPVGQFWTMRLN